MRLEHRSETRKGMASQPGRTGPCCRIRRRACIAVIASVAALLIALFSPPAGTAQTADSHQAGETGLQLAQPIDPGRASPHVTITLADALDRAEKNDAPYSQALTDAKIAKEDRVQMRAAGLPSLGLQTSTLLDQGNGKIATGRYVTQDGVHVYRQWAVLHQEVSLATLAMVGDRKGAALEALARAKAEIARRGLQVTVTKDYYALIVSQRKFATAQDSVREADRFLSMTRDQEQQGQAAHSEVIKAQIQLHQQQAALQEAQLQMEDARLTLAVLLFPTMTENFSVVDDLDQSPSLPAFNDAREMAARENPDLRVAIDAVRASNLDVTAARSALLPSISADPVYGIEANHYAFRSVAAEYPEVGPVPNMGYFATFTLNVPVWDWGALRSKLRQAEYRRQQARMDLTSAQRMAVSGLYSSYNEAQTARREEESLRQAADLAGESLRLTNLRYQAGQALALEVVDAQNTLAQARNTYDDAQARYRLALAQLQTLTGAF